MLQNHHFNLLFFPFDLDLEVPIDFSPLFLDRPVTTKGSSEEVSKLDFFLTSSDNIAPTTFSNYKVSIVLRIMEETTRHQDSGKVHKRLTTLSSSSILTSILVI